MANEVNSSEDASYAPSSAQLELLEVLLEPDDAPIRGTMLIQSQKTIL